MTFQLISAPLGGRDLNIKWGDDELGRAGGEVTWSMALTSITYDTVQFELSDFEDAVQAAFDTWAAVANIDFRLIDGDAQIDIQTGTLAGNTVGLAEYTYSSGNDFDNDVGEIIGATVTMDTQPFWSPFGENGSLSYYAVAAHEIGHTLGLDHVDDITEIMNDFVATNMLGDGDIAGIQLLYGADDGGTDGNDTIDLGSGTTGLTVNARAGDDDVSGSNGNDTLIGGAGQDTLSGNDGADWLIDTLGINTLNGNGDGDVIIGGIGETTGNGGGGGDIVIGGIGDDTLDGGSGNDTLVGDPTGSFFHGDDELTAGTGTDFLEGGGGADTFVFGTSNDTNTIARLDVDLDDAGATRALGADFVSGVDQIELNGFGYASFADVQSALSDVGGSAVFSDQGTVIQFIGVQVSDLDAGDFIL